MIELPHCPRCPATYPPGTLPRCPGCGGPVEVLRCSGSAEVVAATELQAPAEGWSAPHRLLLVRFHEGGTVLSLCATDVASLPAPGTKGSVSLDAERRLRFRP